MVKALRVLNNNVVLARDERGQEVILTGRGIGFSSRQGKAIDPALVQRVFVPTDGRDRPLEDVVISSIDVVAV